MKQTIKYDGHSEGMARRALAPYTSKRILFIYTKRVKFTLKLLYQLV